MVNGKFLGRKIVCIIGPNGAGKSTVLRAVAGQIIPQKGRVLIVQPRLVLLDNPELQKLYLGR